MEISIESRSYRKYPEAIRLQIIRAKNPYLFPELKIPRTTANYWIRSSAEAPPPVSTEEDLLEKRVRSLTTEIGALKSLTALVEKVRVLAPSGFKDARIPSKPIRKQIIDAVLNAVKLNKVSVCLRLVGLSKSTYSRWVAEFFLCESLNKICFQRRPQQLRLDEIKTMERLVTSKKYSHFSISSLCLWAKREGLLVCSVDSWYKYLRIFGWIRPRRKTKQLPEHQGIRAQRANELWHIDVTEVKTSSKQKVYIQVIYDNYSRFVIAWKIATEISAINTVELIESAKKNAQKLSAPSVVSLISDGGPENNNHRVLNYLTSQNVRRIIARVDVKFSNSMVESLFRMLKTNFLRSEDLRSVDYIRRKVEFFFREHNEIIPKVQIGGATPKEKYLGLWNLERENKLKSSMELAAAKRKSDFSAQSCSRCSDLKNDFARFTSPTSL